MREEKLYYPTQYMLLKTSMKRSGTGLPKTRRPCTCMTRSTRKCTISGFNTKFPTGYFSVIDRFQEAKHTTCDK